MSDPSNDDEQPHPLKGKSPWANLTKAEVVRRKKKLRSSQKKRYAKLRMPKNGHRGRPPAHQIQVLEVPVVERAGQQPASASRLDRLAALIVAVERLL